MFSSQASRPAAATSAERTDRRRSSRTPSRRSSSTRTERAAASSPTRFAHRSSRCSTVTPTTRISATRDRRPRFAACATARRTRALGRGRPAALPGAGRLAWSARVRGRAAAAVSRHGAPSRGLTRRARRDRAGLLRRIEPEASRLVRSCSRTRSPRSTALPARCGASRRGRGRELRRRRRDRLARARNAGTGDAAAGLVAAAAVVRGDRPALSAPHRRARAGRGGAAGRDSGRDAGSGRCLRPRHRSGSIGIPVVGSYHTELGPYALHLTRDATRR